jgi:hypothetical protein
MSKTDYLYGLLPTIYRQTDIPRDTPLRALFTILQEQHDRLDSDIARLYDNWFVETCEPWVLPYLAELLGADRIRHDIGGIDARRLIANTLAYRRRKGTIATLEHVAEDATGWSARVVEGTDLLAMTETTKRLRSRAGGTVSVRDVASLDLSGGPFDGYGRTAQVRAHGLSNLDRVGVFLWRLQSYPMQSVEARSVGDGHGRFTFNPLGRDMQLFNRRLRSGGIDRRNGLRNISMPLSRRLLADELRRHVGNGRADDGFLSETAPAFAIYLVDPEAPESRKAVAPSQLAMGDLGDWRRPPASDKARVVVDPERGRLMLLREEDRQRPIRVLTDYCYGLAGDIGGGPYFQPSTPYAAAAHEWHALVGGPAGKAIDGRAGNIGHQDHLVHHHASLGAALEAWARTDRDGIVEIADSGTYPPDLVGGGDQPAGDIRLRGARRSLTIRAAPQQRPCIKWSFNIDATGAAENASVTLEGLLIDGAIQSRGALTLTLRHCTVIPPHGHISIQADHDGSDQLRVVLESTVTAALRLPANVRELRISDSIVDAHGLRAAISAPDGAGFQDDPDQDGEGWDDEGAARLHRAGPPALVERATVIGAAVLTEIRASDSIFTAALAVAHQHQGFVRYCSVAAGSRTPRRYECQPAEQAVVAVDAKRGTRIQPRFTSLKFGHPGYAQLTAGCPRGILAGASNGAEMGAFNIIDDARRQDNLRDMLDEHLPVGYRPVTIYVT